MLTLEYVSAKTESIFVGECGCNKLVIPEPPIHWKDRIAALEAAGLEKQRASCIFDMRRWQAKQLGFEEIDSGDLVKMLMGDAHTELTNGPTRQNYEWTYDHHADVVMDKTWGGLPTIFSRTVRTGLWHIPPFAKKNIWKCQFGKLDYLKRIIPYGVVLKINECKELKLFNCFHVLAPMEAWERKTDIDPIVTATIWELPPTGEEPRTAGQVAHFFLAQW